MLLNAFQKLLEPRYEVVDCVTNGRDVLSKAEELKPDAIILDIGMPGLNGMDAARRLREIVPATRLVFLTVNDDPDVAAEALEIGALGYLLKASAATELFDAIDRVMVGKRYVTPKLGKTIDELRSPQQKTKPTLTIRQREVLQLLAEGHSMKQVGGMLGISQGTVAFHKYRIMEIVGAKSSAELVQYAVKQGLVST